MLKISELALLLALVVCLVGTSGCLGGYPKYYTDFEDYRYLDARQSVYRAARERIKDVEARDYVLYNLMAGSTSLYAGDWKTADLHFERATEVIDSTIGQGRGIVSTAMWESAKYFKGEAYERMALYFYRGLIRFVSGEYDNARAAFYNMTLIDKSAEEPEFQEDAAAAWYMLALTYLELGQEDNARIAAQKAAQAQPDNPCFDLERMKQDNLIVLVETGQGPKKRKHVRNKASSILLSQEGPARNAAVYLDTYHVGQTSLLVDHYRQGVTHGLKGRHMVQALKGGIQEVLDPELGGFILGHADTRSWRFLPHAMWNYCGYIKPGDHNLTLVFPGEDGELSDYRETHHHISVPERGRRVVFLRSQPGQNAHKPNAPKASDSCVSASCEPEAKPFILGGTDYSPPTADNIARWQAAGFFPGKSSEEIVKLYRVKGYEWGEGDLPCNCSCRESKHAVLGGFCLEAPLPATPLNERVHQGR